MEPNPNKSNKQAVFCAPEAVIVVYCLWWWWSPKLERLASTLQSSPMLEPYNSMATTNTATIASPYISSRNVSGMV